MKNITLLLFASWPALWMSAQQTSIPDVDLRDMNGSTVSSSQITQPGTSTLVVFWKLTNGKSCDDLDQLQESWSETLHQKGVRIVAICVDCNGSWTQVRPTVYGNEWEFDTYIDVNGDFRRAMNVGDVPCSLLFNEEQDLVCRYNTACSNNQEEICRNVLDRLDTYTTASNFEAGK